MDSLPSTRACPSTIAQDFVSWLEVCHETHVPDHRENAELLLFFLDGSLDNLHPSALQHFLHLYLSEDGLDPTFTSWLLPRSVELFLTFLSTRRRLPRLRELLTVCRQGEEYRYYMENVRFKEKCQRVKANLGFPLEGFWPFWRERVCPIEAPQREKYLRFINLYSHFGRTQNVTDSFNFETWSRFLSWWYLSKYPKGSYNELRQVIAGAEEYIAWLEEQEGREPWPWEQHQTLKQEVLRIMAWKKTMNASSPGPGQLHFGFFHVRSLLGTYVLLRDEGLAVDFKARLTGNANLFLRPGDFLTAHLRIAPDGKATLGDADIQALLPSAASPFLVS